MEQFIPCALCGGAAVPFKDNYGKFGVYCECCGMYVGIELECGTALHDGWRAKYESLKDARAAWNKRPEAWVDGAPPDFCGQDRFWVIAEIPSRWCEDIISYQCFLWLDPKGWTNKEVIRARRWRPLFGPPKGIACPHGYEDWDDCPDCRH